MRKIIITLAICLPLINIGQAFAEEVLKSADAKGKSEEKKIEEPAIERAVLLNEKQPFDIVFGNDNAPVTMIEYASLSCSHCKKFNDDVIDKLKGSYISDGKLRIVFRHFPLNLPAFKASMLVSCISSSERQRLFVDALFKSQKEWGYMQDEETFMKKLKTIAKIGGLNGDDFDKCLKNKKQEDAILEGQLLAGKVLKVSSTPSIFINGKAHIGSMSYNEVSKIIDKALEELNGK